MAAPPTTIASKKYQPTTTTKYQPFHIRRCFEIYTGKGLGQSLFLIKFQVFGVQLYPKRLRHMFFHIKFLRTHFFLSNTSGRLLLEECNILLKAVLIPISNDIPKAYYQEGFIICFLRSTNSRFMEFLIETYRQWFFLFLSFSCSLTNAQFRFSSSKLTFFQTLLECSELS